MNITSKAMSICLFVRPSVRYYVSLTDSALDSTTRKYLSKISIHKNIFLFHNNNNICQHVFLHKIIIKWVNISINSKGMSVCFIASCRMILHKVDLKHFKLLAWYMVHGIYMRCSNCETLHAWGKHCLKINSDRSVYAFFWYVTAHTARVTRKWCLRICALYTAWRPFRPSNTTSKSFSPPPSPPLHHFQNHAYTRFCVFRHGW